MHIRAIVLAILASTLLPALAAASCDGNCTDADRDGVADRNDQCGGTEAGAPVTVTGCPHDSDADGVADHRDNCPHDAAESVDPWGCPLLLEIELPDVSFEINSARLRAESHTQLDAAVEQLRAFSELRAEVAGHTDSQGNAAHNRALSRLRAEAVRDYLVRSGLDPESITARGYGEMRPIADNETETGRNRNRRVVIRVLGGTRETS